MIPFLVFIIPKRFLVFPHLEKPKYGVGILVLVKIWTTKLISAHTEHLVCAVALKSSGDPAFPERFRIFRRSQKFGVEILVLAKIWTRK